MAKATKATKDTITAVGPVPAETVVDMAAKKADAAKLALQLKAAPCDTPERYQWFSQQLLSVVALKEGVDEQRTKITKPILDSKRAVDGLFTPIVKAFGACEEVIREKLNAYDRKRLQAQEDAMEQAEKAAARGDLAAVNAAIDLVAGADVEGVGHTATKTYRAEVIDFSAVPEWCKQLDEKAVQAYIDECVKRGDRPEVTGLNFVLDVKQRKKAG